MSDLETTEAYCLNSKYLPRIIPHPQANELPAQTLGGLPPLCTPCPQIQPAPNPQWTHLQLAMARVSRITNPLPFPNNLSFCSFELAFNRLIIRHIVCTHGLPLTVLLHIAQPTIVLKSKRDFSTRLSHAFYKTLILAQLFHKLYYKSRSKKHCILNRTQPTDELGLLI